MAEVTNKDAAGQRRLADNLLAEAALALLVSLLDAAVWHTLAAATRAAATVVIIFVGIPVIVIAADALMGAYPLRTGSVVTWARSLPPSGRLTCGCRRRWKNYVMTGSPGPDCAYSSSATI